MSTAASITGANDVGPMDKETTDKVITYIFASLLDTQVIVSLIFSSLFGLKEEFVKGKMGMKRRIVLKN